MNRLLPDLRPLLADRPLPSGYLTDLYRACAGHPAVRILGWAIAVVVAAFLAWKATDNQITQTLFGLDPHDSIRRLIAGTAARPFVFRQFAPSLIWLADRKLDIPDLIARAPPFLADKMPLLCARYRNDGESSCREIVSYLPVGVGFYFVFMMTMFDLGRRVFGNRLAIGFGVMYLAFALENAIILIGLSHTYDWGTLMFGALFLWCLTTDRPVLFCLLMPLACLNKETAILYAPAFLLVALRRMPARRAVALFGMQILSFLLVYGTQRLRYSADPGTWLEIHLMGQIYLFSEHIDLPLLYGLLGTAVLAFSGFAGKPLVLRAGSIMILPWAILFLIGAEPREIRDTFELLPLLVLMVTHSLFALISAPTTPTEVSVS